MTRCRSHRASHAVRGLALIAFVALVAAPMPAAGQADGSVRGVFWDLFDDGPVEEFAYETACPDSAFGTSGQDRTFTFREEPGSTPLPTGGVVGGLGCGEARWRVEVPDGTAHIHVRFAADRQMETPEQDLPETVPRIPNFVQELRIQDVNGAILYTHPYYARAADPSAETEFDLPLFPVPAGVDVLEIVWYFEDTGSSTRNEIQNTDLAEHYSATIRQPRIEFSGAAVDAPRTTDQDTRSGTLVVQEVQVEADLPAGLLDRYGVLLRVAVRPGLDLFEARAPDGTDLGPPQTRDATGPVGYAQDEVLLEQSRSEVQVYVPQGITAQHGPGTYTVVFREVQDIQTVPALVPLALGLLVLPFPFAVAALVGVRAFEREAFGGFRRSAVRLRAAVLLAVIYYVTVLLSALLGHRLELMTAWPLRAEAVFLYVQVFVAIAAFTTLWLVARELYRITKPRPVKDKAAASTSQ